MGKGRALFLTLVAALIVLPLGGMNGLGRLDLALYDWANRKLALAPSADVVLVTIDDPSLQEIGRWPWPRSVLAELINRIAEGQPAAIGVDVLLSELSLDPSEDRALVTALRNSGKVVLPMFSAADRSGQVQALLPAVPFAQAAAAVGHVLVEVDQDGTVRSAFLEEGWTDQRWEHFALSLLRVAGYDVASLPGVRAPDRPASSAFWHRDYWAYIPYHTPGYTRIPVAEVLNGRIDAEFWAGKTVLIGASATGLGDAYPTPVSGDARYMPGVEISANLLDALRGERSWRLMPAWQSALLALLLTALALPLIVRSRPWLGLALMSLSLFLLLGLMLLLLSRAELVWHPVAVALSVLSLYFIWNARRLEFALQYLLKELRLIHKLLPDTAQPASPARASTDVVNRDILQLKHASERLRALHQVIWTVIEGLPDAAMLVDAEGCIVQRNERAKALMPSVAQPAFPGAVPEKIRWSEAFAGVKLVGGETLVSYWLAQTQQQHRAFEAEIAYPGDRHLWLKAVECDNDPMLKGAYIVSLVDISSLRAAEKERDEALRFLSHDLRSPQASILSLVDLLRAPRSSLDLPTALSMISSYADRTISLAEGFVEQARLANQPLRWHPCDLAELLNAALDECWAQANAKRIRLEAPDEDGPFWSVGAGDLLLRSLVNLINNAIKFSPPDSTVSAAVIRRVTGWSIVIRDEGRGMSEADLQQLRRFEAFTRIAAREGEGEESGFGLGLRFVNMVARRHAGFLEMDSVLGEGSCFTLNIWINQPEPVLEAAPSAYNHEA